MEVDYAVLCDACATENGRHFIHSGGWEVVYVDTLPIDYPQICLAVRLRLSAADRAVDWQMEFDVLGPDDASVLVAPVRGSLVPTGRVSVPAEVLTAQCVSFRAVVVRLTREGRFAGVLRVAGAEARRLPFWVVQVAAPRSPVDTVPREAAAPTPRSTTTEDGAQRWLWSGPVSDDDRWLTAERPADP